MDPYFASKTASMFQQEQLESAAQQRRAGERYLEQRLNPRTEGRLSGLYLLLKKLMVYPFLRATPVRR